MRTIEIGLVLPMGDSFTLRRAGRLHHRRIGAAHAGRRDLAIVDEHEVTVVALDTGELLSSHVIVPDEGYWRNQRRDPGRWPGSRAPRHRRDDPKAARVRGGRRRLSLRPSGRQH
jgi:hypothetical protein